MNVSTTPKFFISQAATSSYKEAVEPEVPNAAGKMVQVQVHESTLNTSGEGMFLPIHKASLGIIQKLCQMHQAQSQASGPEIPKTLEAFCDALQQQRWRNFTKADKSFREDSYYTKTSGIEWPHEYYGARKFWTDEWDTEQGWEVRMAI